MPADPCRQKTILDGARQLWQLWGERHQAQRVRFRANQTKSNLLAGLSSASLRRRLRQKILLLCDLWIFSAIPLAVRESR